MKKVYLLLILSCVQCVAYGQATPACLPTAASWSSASFTSAGINAFTITGYSGSNLADAGMVAATSTANGYLSRLALPPVNLLQGGVYASSATWGTAYSEQQLQVWIDFNNDGLFQVTEEVSPVCAYSTTTTVNPTNFNITIPAGAAPGLHLMRLRGEWDAFASTLGVAAAHLDPCLYQYLATNPQYFSGNVVDYVCNIVSACPFTASAANGGPVCPGSPVPLIGATTAPSYSWAGPGGFTSPLLSPTAPGILVPGTYSFTATNGTCSTTLTTNVTLLSAPPVPVVTPSVSTICNGGTVTLLATVPPTPGTILSQNFNTSIAPWTIDNTGTTSASVLAPWQVQPNGYTYVGTTFNSPDLSQFAITNADNGGSGSFTSTRMTSPSFSLVGYSAATLTFQHYYHYYFNDQNANIEISTNGGTTWTVINNYFTGAVSVGTATGFVTATWPLTAYLGNPNCQIRFNYNSTYGFYWAIDNVLITGTPTVGAAPTWTPVTNLFMDPGFTIPYTAGTPAATVYVHPTTIVTTTVFDYIASLTGTCTSSDTGVVTVNPGLPAITGSSAVCVGGSTTLHNPTALGTWTTSNTSVATVDAVSGQVYGVSPGVDTVFYTVTGCTSFFVVTVNTGTPITGTTFSLCTGGVSTTLSDITPGTWSTGSPSIATISPTGLVTSGIAGQAIITYTMAGCSDTALITVLAPPPAITGTTSVCFAGGTTSLYNSVPGGFWTSSNGAIATVNPTSGLVTGLASGSATITYSLLPGCYNSTPVILNPFPSAITGPLNVCAGGSVITLSDTTTGGSWSISPAGFATITSSGLVTGVSAGTTTVAYQLTTGCRVTRSVVVDPLPLPISGTTFSVCQVATITLTDGSTPGTWSTLSPLIATVNAGGGVTGLIPGTATIAYTLPTGCFVSATVTVVSVPALITGTTTICQGGTTTLHNSIPLGTWSSGASSIATVDPVTGQVYGQSAGTANITYSTAGGGSCAIFTPITVSPLIPAGISIAASPSTTVCAGSSVTFTPSLVNGGTAPLFVWSVNNVILSGASSYTYAPANGDLVRCWFISSYACALPDTSSSWLTMTVNPIVTPGLSLHTASGDTICAGSPATITPIAVGAGPVPLYQWFVNLSPISVGPTFTYTPANGDLVKCIMTSSAPCRTANTATSTKLLTVSPPVTPAVALTSDKGVTVCDGYPVIYTAAQLNGGTAPSYQWQVNGVNSGVGAMYSYLPVNNDLVQVTLTSNFPCVTTSTATNSMLMTIVPVVAPVGSIAVSPGYIVHSGANVTFTVTITSGGGISPTYQWLKNNSPIPGATNAIYTTNVLATGDSIACQVTNNDLCSSIATFNSVRMTVAGNTGIQQTGNDAQSVTLLPNPNNGTFIIKGTLGIADDNAMIEITDMIGQVVYSSSAQIVNGQINEHVLLKGGLSSGVYILNVRSQNASKVFHFVLEQQ